IKSRLHRLTQPAKVRHLLSHDRVDSHSLLGRKLELASQSFPHPFAAPQSQTTTSLRSEGRSGASQCLASIVKSESIGGEAKPHPRERDDGQERHSHRPRRRAPPSQNHRSTAAVSNHSPLAGPTSAFITCSDDAPAVTARAATLSKCSAPGA